MSARCWQSTNVARVRNDAVGRQGNNQNSCTSRQYTNISTPPGNVMPECTADGDSYRRRTLGAISTLDHTVAEVICVSGIWRHFTAASVAKLRLTYTTSSCRKIHWKCRHRTQAWCFRFWTSIKAVDLQRHSLHGTKLILLAEYYVIGNLMPTPLLENSSLGPGAKIYDA